MLDQILGEPPQGEPLPGEQRRLLEALLGADLADVRIYPDGDAAAAVDAAGAQAATVGRDIAFAPGAYRPDHPEGVNLLAHEVAHAVQQGSMPAQLETAEESPSEAAPPPRPAPAEASPAVEPAQADAPATDAAAPSETETEAQGAGGPAAETLRLPPTLATPPAVPPIAGTDASEASEDATAPALAEEAEPTPPAEAPPVTATAPAGPAALAGADPLPGWSRRVAAATRAVTALPPTTGGAGAVQRAGHEASSSLDRAAARVPSDAARVITPPDRPTDLPEPPDQATGAALSAVQAAGGRALSPFTLPALAATTPLGRAVALVTAGPGTPAPAAPAAPAPAAGAMAPTTDAPAAARDAERIGAAMAAAGARRVRRRRPRPPRARRSATPRPRRRS